jgi:hypothetical protein
MAGVKPKIQKRPSPQAKASNQNSLIDEKLSYLLTYRNTVKGSNGNNIPRWVRVVVDRKGKILKITTSR